MKQPVISSNFLFRTKLFLLFVALCSAGNVEKYLQLINKILIKNLVLFTYFNMTPVA